MPKPVFTLLYFTLNSVIYCFEEKKGGIKVTESFAFSTAKKRVRPFLPLLIAFPALAMMVFGLQALPVAAQVQSSFSTFGPVSEDTAEPVEVLSCIEHPGERFECWALARYRMDDYVVKVNDFVKSVWRLTRVFHGSVFFENALNGTKVTERLYPSSPPVGADLGSDRSDTLRIISKRIYFFQALHLLAKAGGFTVVSGSTESSFVTLNFSDFDFKKCIVSIVKEAGLLVCEERGIIVIHGRDRTGTMGDLFMELTNEEEHPGSWPGLILKNSLGPTYLSGVSLSHALERIAMMSGLEIDGSAIEGDHNVSIFTGGCDPIMTVRFLAASCGLAARVDGKSIVIVSPVKSPGPRRGEKE